MVTGRRVRSLATGGFSKYGELHERADRDDDQDQNGPGERRQASDDHNRLPQRQSFIRCS